ncbi:MAG TPA: HEAT repeat domain-containing protein [Candidatus Acidoferrum sp.]|nr:HEAT repeat domain-containing protein [Candidatus Acidoferrum sp.]
MDVFVKKGPEQAVGVAEQPLDSRLAPTPDYGTLGPDSDFAKSSGGLPTVSPTSKIATPTDRRPVASANLRLLRLLAVAGGIVAALFASSGRAVWKNIGSTSAPKKNPAVSSARFSERELEREKPQKQAEILLGRAVSRSGGANAEIQAHVEGWRGRLNWNPQLSQLTTVALNSNDQDVRTSGIEVQLAAYGLSKSDSTAEHLLLEANSSDHARKIWALWALGLLGNRGVATDRVVQALVGHLKDSGKDSEDSRRWAIEGLALVGTSATIAPLLDSMHNDPSPLVRERAACSLAESGMLSHEQRLTAVPQLINYSEDPALDAQTHAWAFQALHDITKQHLPNDSAAWRNWYQNSGASGQ